MVTGIASTTNAAFSLASSDQKDYTINLTPDVVSALNKSASGATLTVKDNDGEDGITYTLANPNAIKRIDAKLRDVSEGSATYNTGYYAAGWSAANGQGTSTAFEFYGVQGGNSNAFTLSGMTGITGTSFALKTGGTSNTITFISNGQTYTLGTVSETTGKFIFDATGFSIAAGVAGNSTASITLTDNDDNDSVRYHFDYDTLPQYGASNMRKNSFTQNAGGSYTYTSGGLNAGYAITSASIANLSTSYAGTDTLTWYQEAESRTFTISGVVAPSSASSSVLDYVELNENNITYYIKETDTNGRSQLISGNYKLTGNIDLSKISGIGARGLDIVSKGNVVIDLAGYTISGGSGTNKSVFDIIQE